MAKERVEKLRRELVRAEQQLHAWETGALGERIVAERLAELESEHWRILHDVHWPGRPKANLDHVVVGPGGVVVLDTKNWTGTVELRGGELRQNGYRTARIDSVLDQASAVSALLEPQHRHLTAGWICLVGQADLAGRTNSGVRIEGAGTLIPALRSLPTVLDIVAIDVVARHLEDLLAGDQSPGLWTTRQLEEADGGASRTLQRRRAGARSGLSGVPPQTRSGRSPKRRARKRPGVAGAVIKLSLLVIGIMTLLNIMDGVAESSRPAPAPIPSSTVLLPEGS
ncbi:nuclease-related domain-containing protein [Arthrobacter subterraneus]|uniref:nuclease-related domain-containing protein n=1 Tax=Arthrobacter subterraneus TaxID=335973 RepID=UPI0037FDCB95